MNPPAPRALIAEDEPLLAAALRQELARAWPALEIVATVGDGLSAVQQALARVKAKTLFMPASGDLLLMPMLTKASAAAMAQSDNQPDYTEIPGDWGHLDGVVGITTVDEQIRAFLQ